MAIGRTDGRTPAGVTVAPAVHCGLGRLQLCLFPIVMASGEQSESPQILRQMALPQKEPAGPDLLQELFSATGFMSRLGVIITLLWALP